MSEEKCKHLVLDECSQEHHNNCLGMQQCILDLEQENKRLREALEKIAKQHSSKYINDGEYDEGLKSSYTIAKQALGE